MIPEDLLRKHADSEESLLLVLAHSRKVCEIALRLADQIKRPVDKEFLRKAALLHDIGRFNSTTAFHGVNGGKVMREEGFPKIARVCERHMGAGITNDEAKRLGFPPGNYIPETIEEKLICLADCMVRGDKEQPVEADIERFTRKHGKVIGDRLKRLHEEVMSWIE